MVGMPWEKPRPQPKPPAKPIVELWTAEKIITTEFPPIRWIVPDYLPIGLSTLGGRPKQGKSFMGLQLAIAVGCGGMFLGKRVERGHALYIALEDTPRRMQQRFADMRASVMTEVVVSFRWPPLNSLEGRDLLESYILEHNPRLVVIDTLTRAFSGRIDWDSVSETTTYMGLLQDLALRADACILTIDHHKKMGGRDADEIDDILGSTGKSAVCDTVWGLYRKRGEREAKLRITGRDILDAEIEVYWDRETCCWQAAGIVRPGSVQDAILDALEESGDLTTTELSVLLEKDHAAISRELYQLQDKGLVAKKSQGRYAPWRLVKRVI